MKKQTIESLTKSGYYYVNSDINSSNFPLPENIKTEEYKLIPLEKYTSSEDCLEIIKKVGYRPANIYELALLKENHPEVFIKGKYYIALGSVWIDAGGRHRVPDVCALADGDFRFSLDAWAGDWDSGLVLVCFCDNQHLDTLALNTELNSFESSELTDEQAIEHLKKNGYKITKERLVIDEY